MVHFGRRYSPGHDWEGGLLAKATVVVFLDVAVLRQFIFRNQMVFCVSAKESVVTESVVPPWLILRICKRESGETL